MIMILAVRLVRRQYDLKDLGEPGAPADVDKMPAVGRPPAAGWAAFISQRCFFDSICGYFHKGGQGIHLHIEEKWSC
jgi:hypothetical protein